MVPSKFKRGDRVIGIDLEGREHHGVIKTVWRRLYENVYGVRFDEMNHLIRVVESDLHLEAEYAMAEASREVSAPAPHKARKV